MSKPSSPGSSPRKKTAAQAESTGILGELQSEVSVEAAPLLQFIAHHAAVIMGLLGVFVIVVLGAGVWQWYSSSRDAEAQNNFARLLLQQQGAARVSALEKFAATAPDSVRIAALMELGLAALAEKDDVKASTAFERVAALDKDKPLGIIAALAEAQSLMQAGKAAEALAVLEPLENIVPEYMRVQVRGLIALSAQQAGNLELAVKAYEDMLAGAQGDDADYYRFCIRQIRASTAP